MRWWMAVILAVVCVAVGMLVPLPQLTYERGHIPASKTAEPMANIGPAQRTPEPQETSQANEESKKITILTQTEDAFAGVGLRDEQIDSVWARLDQAQSAQRLWLDFEGGRWSPEDRSNSGRIALELDGENLRLISPQAGMLLLEESTGSFEWIDWDFSRDGQMIAIALGGEESGASVMLYDLRTGDILKIEDARMPRFAPDQKTLYYIAPGKGEALYALALPNGSAERISPKELRVASYIPMPQGIMVSAPQGEGEADGDEQGPPRLALLSGTGEVLRDFSLDVPHGSGQDFLLSTNESGWITLWGDKTEPALLIDVAGEIVYPLIAGEIPIGLLNSAWILRTAPNEYVLRDTPAGEALEVFRLE